MDIWQEIQRCIHLLDVALEECKSRGEAMTKAEADYYTAKAEAVFYYKDTEHLAATLIPLVVKGNPNVNKALQAYEQAKVEYDNAREARNVYKKKLDTLREEYDREYNRAGMNM